MLLVPDGDERLRIVAIDPGTDTMGTAVVELHTRTLVVRVLDAQTFVARRSMRYFGGYQMIEEMHGDRHARLMTHADAISRHLQHWYPHSVACESPFMGNRPQAFEALTECVNVIRLAVFNHDPTLAFVSITPPQAKKTVGASFKGADKNDVRVGVAALIQQGAISYEANVPFDRIDEHSVDALAVGLCHCQQWVEHLTH